MTLQTVKYAHKKFTICKTIYMETIGERVRKLRTDANLTQEKLAEFLRISEPTMSCYETGTRQIPHIILIALARYFDVTTDYLLGLSDF